MSRRSWFSWYLSGVYPWKVQGQTLVVPEAAPPAARFPDVAPPAARFPDVAPPAARFPDVAPRAARFPDVAPPAARFAAVASLAARFPAVAPRAARFPAVASLAARFPAVAPRAARFQPWHRLRLDNSIGVDGTIQRHPARTDNYRGGRPYRITGRVGQMNTDSISFDPATTCRRGSWYRWL